MGCRGERNWGRTKPAERELRGGGVPAENRNLLWFFSPLCCEFISCSLFVCDSAKHSDVPEYTS